MTQSDPNVTTTPEGETVVLEPGDPGYVDPNIANPPTNDPSLPPEQTGGPEPPPTSGETLDPMLPVDQPPPGNVVAPQDLQHQRTVGETDAEFMARTRNVAVISESPSDVVPNTPQITMGVQVPVGDTGLVTGVPAETFDTAQEEGLVPPDATEEVPPDGGEGTPEGETTYVGETPEGEIHQTEPAP